MHKSNTQWDTLQLDIGQLHVGNTVIHFLVLLDEASHFASACEFFSVIVLMNLEMPLPPKSFLHWKHTGYHIMVCQELYGRTRKGVLGAIT